MTEIGCAKADVLFFSGCDRINACFYCYLINIKACILKVIVFDRDSLQIDRFSWPLFRKKINFIDTERTGFLHTEVKVL